MGPFAMISYTEINVLVWEFVPQPQYWNFLCFLTAAAVVVAGDVCRRCVPF